MDETNFELTPGTNRTPQIPPLTFRPTNVQLIFPPCTLIQVINLEQSKCKVSGKCSPLKVNETAEMAITCTSTDKVVGRVESTELDISLAGGDVWYMSALMVDHAGTCETVSKPNLDLS